jgi:uncharacterized protein (DUF2141 family)
MYKPLLIILLILLPAYLFGQGKVVITVTNVNLKAGGDLSAGIFVKANFPKPGQQLIGKFEPVKSATQTITFTDVPAGRYGLVVFQDIDRNKDLKTNFIGFPKEPIGFSRDAKIKMGPPDFDDAVVSVEANKTLNLTIQLKD